MCLASSVRTRCWPIAIACLAIACLALGGEALAHGIEGSDAVFVARNAGPQIVPFFYLGAKHMVTGYDHLLFLLGIIFFLHRLRQIALYVTLFSIGHSATLLLGVLGDIQVNARLVDAVIGLSVAYKAFDNLDGFHILFGFRPDTRTAVLGFGLIHGFGLATKLQALRPSPDGLVANLIAFNVGVETGQILALVVLLAIIAVWRRTGGYARQAVFANWLVLAAGIMLTMQHLLGYFMGRV